MGQFPSLKAARQYAMLVKTTESGRSMMQLKQLAYFVKVVERGSISRAAAELYLAQSSLSQSIQTLEQELGFPLLRRGRDGVAPTEMGELVCRGAKDLLASADRLTESWKQTYREHTSLNGLVRIAVIPGTHPILMRQILSRIKESYPHIRYKVLEVRDPVLLPCLAEDQVDLVLSGCLIKNRGNAEAFAREQELELVALRTDAYKIAVGANRPLAKRAQLTAKEAEELPLACYFGGDAAAELYFEHFFNKDISVEYTSIEKMVQEAEHGPGVSVLPELTVRNTYPGVLRFLTVEAFCVPFVHFVGFRRGAGARKEVEVTVQAVKRVFSGELK